MDKLTDFYQVSVVLTGYNRSRLMATGVGEEYFQVLSSLVPEKIIDELFICSKALAHEYKGQALNEKFREQILSNDRLGPVARNILKMWYLSLWYQLPQSWRESYGLPSQSPGKYQDVDFVISENAYIQGLVWPALGSHPMGAKQPGYGTWAFKPGEEITRIKLDSDPSVSGIEEGNQL
ncbi:hypothetical protein [Thalassomonas haliotis]|uniref:Uncharacterized protein n=1 Tax=Thalassomonas haliotis TaxID=485448 RepID=A0ABY7VJY3_9GAMM|nr:hypothetical protein [Thalassomonas haliotis]WDE13479.1 hypothetical protein H3N35_08610 [Thalassomonas haliotis]